MQAGESHCLLSAPEVDQRKSEERVHVQRPLFLGFAAEVGRVEFEERNQVHAGKSCLLAMEGSRILEIAEIPSKFK